MQVTYYQMFLYEKICLQVGFFGGICIPCYDLLSKVMPSLTPMLEQCRANWAQWKQLAEQRKQEERERKERENKEKEGTETQ